MFQAHLILEGDAAAVHDLLAFGALGGELLLEAGDAVHVVVVRDDEGPTADLKRQTQWPVLLRFGRLASQEIRAQTPAADLD